MEAAEWNQPESSLVLLQMWTKSTCPLKELLNVLFPKELRKLGTWWTQVMSPSGFLSFYFWSVQLINALIIKGQLPPSDHLNFLFFKLKHRAGFCYTLKIYRCIFSFPKSWVSCKSVNQTIWRCYLMTSCSILWRNVRVIMRSDWQIGCNGRHIWLLRASLNIIWLIKPAPVHQLCPVCPIMVSKNPLVSASCQGLQNLGAYQSSSRTHCRSDGLCPGWETTSCTSLTYKKRWGEVGDGAKIPGAWTFRMSRPWQKKLFGTMLLFKKNFLEKCNNIWFVETFAIGHLVQCLPTVALVNGRIHWQFQTYQT